jgi:molybdopterin-dependent oxidoreductase alpha subunit
MGNRIYVQPPTRYTGIRLTTPKDTAGGIEAVVSSMKHVFGEVGVLDGTRTMLKLNQFHGFDCPGCAWPDPDEDRSTVEFCENGAKAVAEEATVARADKEFFSKYTISQLSAMSDYELGKSGRIDRPYRLVPGNNHYRPVSWEQAFGDIGSTLNRLDSPDEAVFYTSGRTSNEAAFLYQLFVRQFGTNNLPDCSNMCHESSGAGLTETLGIGKGSVILDDFYKAEVIVIMGQNPGTNHPRMLTALQKAKKNGAKIITINPLKETGLVKFRHPQHPVDLLGKATTLTDIFLQIKINADVPLLKALMKLLLLRDEESGGKVLDHSFIEKETTGFGEFIRDLRTYDLEELIEATGIPRKMVTEAADLLASKERIIICWAMGLTQHRNAVDNVREIVNLLLMKGSIGKPGAGTCPVRGHSNVQGDRTVGIWERLNPAFGDALEREFKFKPPRKEGYDTVNAIQAMKQGKVKVFMAMGGNFLSAAPDTEVTAMGLMKCDMTVHISTKLNRSHLTHGRISYILPCLGRTELDVQKNEPQFVTVENSTGVVHQSRGGKSPVSKHLLSEPKIVAELAKATLHKRTLTDWDYLVEHYDHIRDAIEKTIPGFEIYNQRVRKSGGFYLPNGARERKFHTTTGKANFSINALPDYHLREKEYLMMTIRSHDQYNTTIYGLDDRYRGIYNERRVVMMNLADMEAGGFQALEKVDLFSNYDGIERMVEGFLVVPYDIPTKCVATYFPEANPLIPHTQIARTSNTPISKSVVIQIRRKDEL